MKADLYIVVNYIVKKEKHQGQRMQRTGHEMRHTQIEREREKDRKTTVHRETKKDVGGGKGGGGRKF